LSGGGSDGGGGAKGSGGAEDGADVAGILDAGENDEERSADTSGSGEEFIQRKCAGLDEGGDALGMFGVGDALEEAIGGAENGKADVGTADERGEALAVAFAGFAEEDGGDAAGGAESFFDEARAFDADRAIFCGQAAAESDAEVLKPAVVAAGEKVGGVGGFVRRGHWRKVSKSASGGEEPSAVNSQRSVENEGRVESQKLKVERKEEGEHQAANGIR